LVFQQTLRAAAGTSTAAASNPSSSLMFDSLSQLPTTTNTQNNTHMHTQIHRLLACFPLLRQRHRATTPTKCTNKKIKKLKIPKPPPLPPPGGKKTEQNEDELKDEEQRKFSYNTTTTPSSI
jgi:hypothetical protein